MVFGDLKTAAGLKSLNDYLCDRSYVEGYQPSQADVSTFESITTSPVADLVHALRWYNHIKSFGEERKSFPGAKQSAIPAATSAKADDDECDDDDFELFGSDEETNEAAERIKQERLAAYEAKKSKKPEVIAKSSIVLDVKPWDDETDMAEIERCVRSIEADGLLWGASKLVPLAYGIKKLQIMCVVEDDKMTSDICPLIVMGVEPHVYGQIPFLTPSTIMGVGLIGTDFLEEEITKFEELVQSVDIAAFNKI